MEKPFDNLPYVPALTDKDMLSDIISEKGRYRWYVWGAKMHLMYYPDNVKDGKRYGRYGNRQVGLIKVSFNEVYPLSPPLFHFYDPKHGKVSDLSLECLCRTLLRVAMKRNDDRFVEIEKV